MSQNIENDLAAITGLSAEEVTRVAHYVRARMKEGQPEGKSKKKNRRADTRQLSGKNFLQHMRERLQEMFEDGEDSHEIVKAAVGFALENYHNGVEVGRGERRQGGYTRPWFGRKRRY